MQAAFLTRNDNCRFHYGQHIDGGMSWKLEAATGITKNKRYLMLTVVFLPASRRVAPLFRLMTQDFGCQLPSSPFLYFASTAFQATA